jgi:hypothetical protein
MRHINTFNFLNSFLICGFYFFADSRLGKMSQKKRKVQHEKKIRLQVLTKASTTMTVFWDVALCSLVAVY